MAFTLKIKSSTVQGKVPDAGALETAELGLNLVDRKLYSKDANGTVFEIGAAGDTPSGPTPPSDGNQLGDLFFDTFNNILLYWNGVDWVPVGTEAIALGDLNDVELSDGSLADGQILVYNGSEWVNADLDIPSGTVISETPPDNPASGQLWWNSSDDSGRLFVYYEDGDSSQWVEASPQGAGGDFSQAEADALYLSKTKPDTAAGEITFADGLHATSGEIRSTSIEERPFRSTATGTKVGHFGFWADADNATVTDAAFGFYASNSLNSISGNPTEIIGFDSKLTEGPNIYNFYAGGSAENYFEGLSTFNNGIQITGGNGIQISGETHIGIALTTTLL